MDLTGYIVANGGTSYTYSSITLSGTINSCDTYVVGGQIQGYRPKIRAEGWDHAVPGPQIGDRTMQQNNRCAR